MGGESVDVKKGNFLDAFLAGARQGFTIGTTATLPNVFFAFVLIQVFEVTGLLDVIEVVFAPIMALFGLPGAAAAVLISGAMSMGGGMGVAAGLVGAGSIPIGPAIAIVLVGNYLMGSMIQWVGRIVGTIGINPKYNLHMVIICLINAFTAMFLTNLFLF